jgi:hypothetical protein
MKTTSIQVKNNRNENNNNSNKNNTNNKKIISAIIKPYKLNQQIKHIPRKIQKNFTGNFFKSRIKIFFPPPNPVIKTYIIFLFYFFFQFRENQWLIFWKIWIIIYKIWIVVYKFWIKYLSILDKVFITIRKK